MRGDVIVLILNNANPSPTTALQLQELIQTSMAAAKCRKCGCMKETLLTIQGQLSEVVVEGRHYERLKEASHVLSEIGQAVELMEPIEYT